MEYIPDSYALFKEAEYFSKIKFISTKTSEIRKFLP